MKSPRNLSAIPHQAARTAAAQRPDPGRAEPPESGRQTEAFWRAVWAEELKARKQG